MSIYVSDKEQVEMLKKWWQENGKFTLASIIIALLLSAGWRYWQNTKMQDRATASAIYEQMLSHEANKDFQAVSADVQDLQANHHSTPYAALGSLLAAQNDINTNELDSALKKLNWIVHNSKNEDFSQIAKIRLARVLLGMKKYDDALAALKVVEVNTYLPLVQELTGDIFRAKGDLNAARFSYQRVLQSLSQNAPNRALLQMKVSQLGS